MAKRKKQKKKTGGGKVFGIILIAALVLYAVTVVCDVMGMPGGTMTEITVESGSGTADIAAALQQKGVIMHPAWFRLISKLGGHDGSYQQGGFVLRQKAGYAAIMKTLQDTPNQSDAVRVTIPEGFELRQIADRLEEQGLIDRKAFYNAVENGHFDYDFLKNLPKRENRLEGYLFPDTYMFRKGEGEEAVINNMMERFDEMYTPELRARAKALSMTDDEVITLASVIEREAQGDADRDLVSGVFHNRLKSTEYPYLQSCATVQYILKERKAVLSVADTKIESLYNTYLNPGLPVGPIASPGLASIKAALYPAETDYLFFVLDSTGKHRFAKTYAEHQENMKK